MITKFKEWATGKSETERLSAKINKLKVKRDHEESLAHLRREVASEQNRIKDAKLVEKKDSKTLKLGMKAGKGLLDLAGKVDFKGLQTEPPPSSKKKKRKESDYLFDPFGQM